MCCVALPVQAFLEGTRWEIPHRLTYAGIHMHMYKVCTQLALVYACSRMIVQRMVCHIRIVLRYVCMYASAMHPAVCSHSTVEDHYCGTNMWQGTRIQTWDKDGLMEQLCNKQLQRLKRFNLDGLHQLELKKTLSSKYPDLCNCLWHNCLINLVSCLFLCSAFLFVCGNRSKGRMAEQALDPVFTLLFVFIQATFVKNFRRVVPLAVGHDIFMNGYSHCGQIYSDALYNDIHCIPWLSLCCAVCTNTHKDTWLYIY